MAKHVSATAALRTKGWYRQLQTILLGEATEQPKAPKMLQEMDLRGLDIKEGKATYGRWHKGECRPDAKYVMTLIKQLGVQEQQENLSQGPKKHTPHTALESRKCTVAGKLADWWKRVAPDLEMVKDDQIRLLGHIDWWATPSADEATLLELLRSIWLGWEPKSRGVWPPCDNEVNQRWEIEPLNKEQPSGRIHYELAHRSDPTSMAAFLLSLCNLPWLSQETAINSSPYQHNSVFSTWCVDTISCCMLVERLHQRWGSSSYSLASPGIGVASLVTSLIFAEDDLSVMTLSPDTYFQQNRVRQLTEFFRRRGVPVDDAAQFHRSFFGLTTLIERMLRECGSSTTEIAKLQNVRKHPAKSSVNSALRP